MNDRDASDVNAEFARQTAETARERAMYAQTAAFSDLAHRTTMQLMRETERIAKRDRWIPWLSLMSLTCSVVALYVVWHK